MRTKTSSPRKTTKLNLFKTVFMKTNSFFMKPASSYAKNAKNRKKRENTCQGYLSFKSDHLTIHTKFRVFRLVLTSSLI